MTLDIILLIATIVVAVLAVIVGLIRAVLERRRGSSLWEQYRSRRIDPQRLERAVPGPTAEDGAIRALERQAPAMGSRPAFAALGAPAATEPVAEPDSRYATDLIPDAEPLDVEPARVYAYARASDEPDAELASATIEPVASAEIEPAAVATVVEAEPAPTVVDPELGSETEPEAEPGLTDAAMAELGIVTTQKRSGGKRGAVPPPVEETIDEPAKDLAEEPAEEPVAASSEPVPLFLPGTYTVGAADLEEPAIKREDAPAPAARTAAMTAGYAPTARAVFVPPPPDVIEDELAYRIGVRGARRPSQSTAVEAAGGPEALAPILPTVETESWPERRSRRRRRAAIGMTAIAAAVVLAVGASTLPGLLEQGGVLGETGQPPASVGGGVPLESPSPSLPVASSQPTLSPTPQASPSPAATPSSAAPSPSPSASAAAGGSVTTASVTPRPSRNTVRPPITRFDCTSVGLVLTCDGSKSSGATDYVWDFGEGPTVPGVTASHPYAASGSYLVTLVVTGPGGSTSRSQSFIVP